jgi:murein DD-endopeptidase MepM/ murein hydrolase activator NlpD
MLTNAHSYTFSIGRSNRRRARKIQVAAHLLHLLAALAILGGAVALGSYSRLLWKLADYNALRREAAILRGQNQELQASVSKINEHLLSLQSLAAEVAMTYGFMRFRETPFGLADAPVQSEIAYQRSVEQFDFLRKNPTAVALATQGLRLMPRPGLGDARFTPSLWPVIGHISGSFGERLDPFSGEGVFHAGVDISSPYGDPVRATADGVVAVAEARAGYGRFVVVDHNFGISTWYGHLSGFNTRPGTYVKRGDVIGFVGVSGRVTGPHVHYEVRIHGAPVNPSRYLRFSSIAD